MATKAAQREATMQKLIDFAREFFTRYGYAQTATEDLVREAGVTRGALYHHFGSKEGLFKAVLEDVQREIAERIDAASASDDLWEQLRVGCRVFLEASLDPHVQRILLIDAPAVLGWEVWRAMDADNSMRLLHTLLSELVATQQITPLPVDALTHLLSGAMNEAALWIARASNQHAALDAAVLTLERLLDGLRLT